MSEPIDSGKAIVQAMQATQHCASQQLKVLIETKHIYQRISFFPSDKIEEIRSTIIDDERHRGAFKSLLVVRVAALELFPTLHEIHLVHTADSNPMSDGLDVRVDNVKIFCKKCGEREASAPLWCGDVFNEILRVKVGPLNVVGARGKREIQPKPAQVFCVAYQCQRCKGGPQVFTIRREGWHLILDGRSPMEEVAIPAYMPKAEGKLFADAVVSAQGGKPLAALFYLRTFIEQFARRETNSAKDVRIEGDVLFELYSKRLPEAQRGSMPSLKFWYQKLSEALHAANADEKVFQEAREQIEQHFEIRRAFRMP